MKRTLFIIGITNLFLIPAFAQLRPGQISMQKVPAPVQHYQQEYTFDTTVNKAAWHTLSKGLHVSFASTNELYFRSEVPALEKEAMTWQDTGWKGERINTQVLVWSADTINQVRFILKDLRNAKGQSIAKNNIQAQLVRYVVSNYPYGARDVTCGDSPYPDLYLMPDRFEALDRFDLPARSVRPVWLYVNIPAGTPAGKYDGTIEVQSQNTSTTLHIQLDVQNQLLPKPYEWKHRLDLWQNPWVVAWQNNVKPWGEEHKQLLKKHLQLYADAGGKYITTYCVHSPWSDNSYRIEETMIEWIKRRDGGWKFDYSIFDQYVQLAISVGIDKAITIYTPVPWGFRFRYLDEKTGNYRYETWAPDSKPYKQFWNIFLTNLKKHLLQKGWFNKTYLGINENEMDQTLAAIKVIKEHDKQWKITYAGNWHPQLDSLLNDYCFLYGNESGVDVVNQRTARAQTTTWYVCCNPPVPNNFLFSPPIEGRWMGWYTAAHGYSGFLRWAYDAWPADVMRDARHTFWPSGDCYLVYPGGNSCIRFEKMREGIADYEKIRILKQKTAASSDPRVKQLWKELEQHMQAFLTEKDFNAKKITGDVMKGRNLVNQLSQLL